MPGDVYVVKGHLLTIFAEHIDDPAAVRHRLVLLNARTLRCHDCQQTLLLPASSSTPPAAPRLGERCPKHVAGWANSCAGCRADELAAYEAPVLPLDGVRGPQDVRAVLAQRRKPTEESA